MAEPNAAELFAALVELAAAAADAQALLLGIEISGGEHYPEQDRLKFVIEEIANPAIARGRRAMGLEKGGPQPQKKEPPEGAFPEA
jgi:hypothetical protein